MKHLFFECLVHLGFLLCHLGCRLTGTTRITSEHGNVTREYQERYILTNERRGD